MNTDIHYIKADPSGNTTIFVLDDIEPSQRAALAAQLLRTVGAEQVGYLQRLSQTKLSVHMMGGEFCGNASRSAAALALARDGGEAGDYEILCSGCGQPLAAHAEKRPDGVYMASIVMPMPTAVDAVIIDTGGMPGRFFRVTLPGIVHFVHFVDDMEHADKDMFWQSVYDYAKDEDYEAFGLVLFAPKTLSMVPAVYVAGTDTLYWEQSCGSGSAAVTAALACLGKQTVQCTVHQPGGDIAIYGAVDGGELKEIQIGGPVTFEGL